MFDKSQNVKGQTPKGMEVGSNIRSVLRKRPLTTGLSQASLF